MMTVANQLITAPAVIETAPEVLEVVIAHRHIEHGKKGFPARCAAALALVEAGFTKAEVGLALVRVWDSQGSLQTYSQTDEFIAWRRAFDGNFPVYPERFLLKAA